MDDHIIIDYGDARRWGKMASYDPTEARKNVTSPAYEYHSTEGSTTTPFYQEPFPGQPFIVEVGLGVGIGVAVAIILCLILSVGLIMLGSKIHSYIMRRNFLSQLQPVQPVRPLMNNSEQDMEHWPAAGKESVV